MREGRVEKERKKGRDKWKEKEGERGLKGTIEPAARSRTSLDGRTNGGTRRTDGRRRSYGREQRAEERKQKRGIGQDTAWWTRRHGRVPRIRNATPHAAYPEQAVRDPAQTA